MSPPSEAETEVEAAAASRPSIRKIIVRVVVTVGLLAVTFLVLRAAFDDLDPAEIRAAIKSLDDAELLSLFAMWILWLASQGLQTAALVPRLPVRRGVLAFLGPAAVASVVPGPSDLPVRYRMLTSWGETSADATLAVAAGGVFSIGIKLVLPVLAAIGLLVSGAPIEGAMRTVVAIALVVGAGVAAFVVVFSSESRTQRVGGWLDPVWRSALRLMRRPERDDLGQRLVAARARAVDVLRDRWLIASWGTLLAAATKFALLLMSLRFTGVSEDELSWTEVFVVYALVQGLTVIPITAGDAGVSELAYIGLLTAAAGSGSVNQITAAVIIFRLLTWLAIIPAGLVALGLWRHSLRRPATAQAGAP